MREGTVAVRLFRMRREELLETGLPRLRSPVDDRHTATDRSSLTRRRYDDLYIGGVIPI